MLTRAGVMVTAGLPWHPSVAPGPGRKGYPDWASRGCVRTVAGIRRPGMEKPVVVADEHARPRGKKCRPNQRLAEILVQPARRPDRLRRRKRSQGM